MDCFPNSLLAVQRMFPDEAACAEWLFSVRWPEGFACSGCGHRCSWTRRGKPEWAEVLRDLDRCHEIEVDHDGERFVLRTPATGVAGKLFRAVGVALPPNIREARPEAPAR